MKYKKSLISVSAVLLLSYIGICGYFYLIQNTIIFRPSQSDISDTYSYNFPFEERWFEPEEGVRIHAIHAFADSDSAGGLVIYHHGNRGNNRTNPAKFELFLNAGYDVLYPDYREYGKSSGELWNEEDLVGDMAYVFDQMEQEYNEENIIVMGYSLGAGVAAQVAAANDPKMLIMWTPFYSMIDMKDAQFAFLPDFLVRFPLRTDLALQKIEEPVYIFYAGEDQVLPLERSLRLTEHLKERDKYFVLENQGHGWIYRNQELLRVMEEILNR
ncbi:MAG: alpha/beta fold hydrolase [Gracilimonas sp.]|uniref:alpha/beta hydrolase n=1 Tax=Gracilimonas sp. TaxID=1974203 RepID=UPI001B08B0FE|nr:alpha/beta fold hydrolase [Gracilimonas sp.]MBO6586112.1 alpha/beta fold hydrolase [Gracilimonas sp.]MBO6614769.1 alpha/beta fold hydrolase [Gracilimonas sp.]